jgi:oxygen-independent coproporphyrinogen-3 oxidase
MNRSAPSSDSVCSSESSLPTKIALYIHIPFCQTKCPYCDFNTYAGIEPLMPNYIKALTTEILHWGALLGKPEIRTIFFGGGTPSYVPVQSIETILRAAQTAFHVSSDAEITMEANPGDLMSERATPLRKLGINRLSIGTQSLDDSLLKVLGRRHSSQEAVDAYGAVRMAGFDNISLDLMYGLPSQTIHQWRDSLKKVLSLSPEHLSLYCLTLEEGTPMHQQMRLGEMSEPDPDLAADMYLLAENLLEQAGYDHYEISNWAKPGMESLHNLTYWHNQPYIGVGPGAHSYLGMWRFNNINSPREYIRRFSNVATPSTSLDVLSSDVISQVPTVDNVEIIEHSMEMAETMMLGLRLSEGISLEHFANRFGRSLDSVYGEQIQELISLKLLEQRNRALYLTDRGRLLGNEVFLRFF